MEAEGNPIMRQAFLAIGLALLLCACRSTPPDNDHIAPIIPATGPFVPVNAVAAQRLAEPPLIDRQPSRPRQPDMFTNEPAEELSDLLPRQPRLPIAGFTTVNETPATTIPIGADTASYGMARQMLRMGRWPAAAAVRPEEFLNAFAFDYPRARRAQPLEPFVAMVPAPWDATRRLLHLGIRALDAPRGVRPPLNLTFVLDASASMFAAERLPIVIEGIRALIPRLNQRDRLSIITYSPGTRTLLDQMRGDRRVFIEAALGELRPGVAEPAGSGIDAAYAAAGRALDTAALNRVILVTDGDFNLGAANPQALEALVKRQRERGIRLSTITVGLDAPADTTMRALAHAGGGLHGFAADAAGFQQLVNDDIERGRAIVAQALRLEVEFNIDRVQEYRLIGFTSRRLSQADFAADRLGAGEIPAGRAITAIFELAAPVSGFRSYSTRAMMASTDYATLRIRHTQPDGGSSRLIQRVVVERDWRANLTAASPETRFGVSVAGFALMLGQAASIDWPYAAIEEAAAQGIGDDPDGKRADFLTAVHAAGELQLLRPRGAPAPVRP
jgi:Ca-activated chloride channel family protein